MIADAYVGVVPLSPGSLDDEGDDNYVDDDENDDGNGAALFAAGFYVRRVEHPKKETNEKENKESMKATKKAILSSHPSLSHSYAPSFPGGSIQAGPGVDRVGECSTK